MKSLNSMTKKEIDAYGETIGLKLDGRKKKSDLIKQVEEFLAQQSDKNETAHVEPRTLGIKIFVFVVAISGTAAAVFC